MARREPATRRAEAKYDNFYEEFKDCEVDVVLQGGTVISGRVVESRRYWIKLENASGRFYINKAWIVYVQPKLRAEKPG